MLTNSISLFLALVALLRNDLIFISIVCLVFVIGFFRKGSRVVFLSTLLLYLYCFLPWIFALYGGVYFDLDYGQVENGVLYSSKLLLISYTLILPLCWFWDPEKEKMYFESIYEKLINISGLKLIIIRLVSICVGLITIFEFLIYGNVDNLRWNKEILTLSENQYYQIIFLPICLIYLCRISKKISYIDILLVLLSLSSFLLSGSRKEIFILFCSLFFLYRRPVGIKSMLIMFIFISFMLILPLFREGSGVYDIFVSFHEFILPQYGFFLYLEHAQSYSFENSDLISGFWSLLPNFLRLSQFITIGNSLSQYGLVNIGLASNPALEAHINFGENGYFIFPVIVLSYFCLGRFIIEKKITYLCPFVFYLIVFGRSDFWLTVFFATYTSVFMFFLIKKFRKND